MSKTLFHRMATRNKRKLAALNKENCEENPRSNLASNSNFPRSQEDYITQVSEEIEGSVTKKLSQEFSRTENRILDELARLDDFLINALLQGHSGFVVVLFWARVSCHLTVEEARFRMTIILGVVLIRSLAYT